MRRALALVLWLAVGGSVVAQGMYTPVVEPRRGLGGRVVVVSEPIEQTGPAAGCCEAAVVGDDCCACRDRPGWYGGCRTGVIEQDRGQVFQFGSVALPAASASPVIFDTPSFGLAEWSYYPEVFVGRELGERSAVEARFAYARYDDTDGFRLNAPVAGSADVSLLVPFLDARSVPVAQGVAGIGLRAGDVGFSYDSDYYDWGFDLVRRWLDHGRARVEFLAGLSFAQISQQYAHYVSGVAGQALNEPRLSILSEDIDEWYYGPRLGLRGWCHAWRRLDLEGACNLHLLVHHANLSGQQEIAAQDAGGAPLLGPLNIGIRDSSDDFVPRLDFLVGCRWRVSDQLALTVAYRFAAWFGAASVDNPDLVLAPGPAWQGQLPARLADEDLLTHSLLGGLIWQR